MTKEPCMEGSFVKLPRERFIIKTFKILENPL